jgi:hypothetical protein
MCASRQKQSQAQGKQTLRKSSRNHGLLQNGCGVGDTNAYRKNIRYFTDFQAEPEWDRRNNHELMINACNKTHF